jgi:hypothetical protein
VVLTAEAVLLTVVLALKVVPTAVVVVRCQPASISFASEPQEAVEAGLPAKTFFWVRALTRVRCFQAEEQKLAKGGVLVLALLLLVLALFLLVLVLVLVVMLLL